MSPSLTDIIETLLAEEPQLSGNLARPPCAYALPEVKPRRGEVLVVWMYMSRPNVSKGTLEAVVRAAANTLDKGSIWKPFTRVGVTIAVAEGDVAAEKICYVEVDRGKLARLRDLDIFSSSATQRTEGVLVVWPSNDLVAALLAS